ncbi:hypothetical protein HMPREF1492_0145 [Atopobium sp. BS2]|nr:hypothetical protein HMPREF1492_0145 [Atopobium sp. BS2]
MSTFFKRKAYDRFAEWKKVSNGRTSQLRTKQGRIEKCGPV